MAELAGELPVRRVTATTRQTTRPSSPPRGWSRTATLPDCMCALSATVSDCVGRGRHRVRGAALRGGAPPSSLLTQPQPDGTLQPGPVPMVSSAVCRPTGPPQSRPQLPRPPVPLCPMSSVLKGALPVLGGAPRSTHNGNRERPAGPPARPPPGWAAEPQDWQGRNSRSGPSPPQLEDLRGDLLSSLRPAAPHLPHGPSP